MNAGLELCTGRVEQLAVSRDRENIEKTAYFWPTDDPYSWWIMENPVCCKKQTG